MPAATRAIRWNVEQAAGEFGIDRKTLSKRIRAAGIEPGEDGKYATRQITTAVYGDYESERTRESKARANLLELDEEKRRARLLDAEDVYKHYEGVFVVYRQKTLACSMTDEEKDELLGELRGLKTRIFTD